MMKKITAVLLAAAMLLCFTGCETAPEEQVGGVLTFDELTNTLGYAIQQTEQAVDELSLPVTFKLDNSEELLDFMLAISENRPCTYTNTLQEIGVGGVLEDVTYTVDYDGASAYITREVNGEVTGPVAIAQFGMALLANACQDMLGNFDQALFEQMIDVLDVEYWYKQYPYHMLYGVNAVIAVTADGQYVVFDYYFDKSVNQMLAAGSAQ